MCLKIVIWLLYEISGKRKQEGLNDSWITLRRCISLVKELNTGYEAFRALRTHQVRKIFPLFESKDSNVFLTLGFKCRGRTICTSSWYWSEIASRAFPMLLIPLPKFSLLWPVIKTNFLSLSSQLFTMLKLNPFLSRELYLKALLFFIYLIIICFGYASWRKKYFDTYD